MIRNVGIFIRVNETEGVVIMTITQQFKAQGMEKCIQQGVQQGIETGDVGARKTIAKKLLREGLPLETVSRVTELSLEELKLLMIEKNH